MAFQPFGYRFEIESPVSPAKVKSDLRARKKAWFDPKDGARGWVAGPFICLWMSAFDRYGPMLFGRIRKDGFGTMVSGRAGSDLNGLALYILLVPLLAFLLWQMIRAGEASTNQIAIIGGLILLSPLMLWWGHRDRKHAEPLVRFIRNTITTSGQTLRTRTVAATISPQVRMTVSGENRSGTVTAQSIYDALTYAGVGDSVILATEPQAYIQTLLQEDGFNIERRAGDHLRHFRGVRRETAPERGHVFTFEEVLAALIAYASKAALPDVIAWEPMELPE